VIVDANVLLYAVETNSPHHEAALQWLEAALNGQTRVGLPWTSLTAFLRISTNPRITANTLTSEEAWSFVDDWLREDVAWIPVPTSGHAQILRALLVGGDIRGNLVADAHLAALAIEHGVAVCSADSDFARFPGVRWINPLAAG
jgi:toxin-antitoxin system PIN domain toxin